MSLDHNYAGYFDNDWQYAEGVEDLGIEWGDDRVFRATAPTAPAYGIKGRRGNPTDKQLMFQNGQGLPVKTTDQVWTIWRSTFVPNEVPKQGDILIVVTDPNCTGTWTPVERWMVQWAKETLYGAQYLIYCAESPLNQDVVHFVPPA